MGFFNKIAQGLKKTRDSMMGKVDALLNSFTKIDEDFFEELEENLIMADVGAVTAARICRPAAQKGQGGGTCQPDQVRSGLKQIISQMLEGPSELDLSTKPSVILVIGVNGWARPPPSASLPTTCASRAKRCCWQRQIPSVQLPSTSCRSGQTVRRWIWCATRKAPTGSGGI